MRKTDIKFTYHAMKRARQRKLWKYVNRAIVLYDAEYVDTTRVRFKNCIYALVNTKGKTIVKTMYSV